MIACQKSVHEFLEVILDVAMSQIKCFIGEQIDQEWFHQGTIPNLDMSVFGSPLLKKSSESIRTEYSRNHRFLIEVDPENVKIVMM